MDAVPSVISEYVSAYNDMNVERMVCCLSNDIHFVNTSAGTITAETRGVDQFRALAQHGIAAFSERRQSITNCIAVATHGTLRIAYHAVVAIDLPNGWKTGQAIGMEGVSLFTLKDGKIVELVDIG